MAVSTFFVWLGTVTMVGGLIIECAALVATKYYPLARCLPWQAIGGILFFAGAVILVVARAFS
jgi:hypothetical protein